MSLSPKVANRVQNLALLLDNEDAFEMDFKSAAKVVEKPKKKKGGKDDDFDHIENLMKHSRTFIVNE